MHVNLGQTWKSPREVLWYKLFAVPLGTAVSTYMSDTKWHKVACIRPKQELVVVLLSKAITSPSTLSVLCSPLLLGSSAGMCCSTSSGSRKSLFKISITCILRRLTRSTSFNLFSSCFTISLLDWLVKIVIWNTNQSVQELPLPLSSLDRW